LVGLFSGSVLFYHSMRRTFHHSFYDLIIFSVSIYPYIYLYIYISFFDSYIYLIPYILVCIFDLYFQTVIFYNFLYSCKVYEVPICSTSLYSFVFKEQNSYLYFFCLHTCCAVLYICIHSFGPPIDFSLFAVQLRYLHVF
jgi:hypothetical protein